MPDLDGYQLARMLRAEFSFEQLRLVALTAYGEEADRVASRQAGFDAHVSKPSDPEVIDCILRTMFEGGRAVRR
jgi:two-component system CheB/CheR fusion protein